MANSNLTSAKKAKNDEFYTQTKDIEKEMEAYINFNPDAFRGKVVYCNCDDPFESNFFKYFANKFKEYGLKKLITTSYIGSPIAQTELNFSGTKDVSGNQSSNRDDKKPYRIEINDVADLTDDGITNLDDVKWLLEHDKNTHAVLKGDAVYVAGDFRSKECIELLKEADIVVTNPPFSLFREYIKQLVEYNKKFVIIGNMNAITYKEVFPLIKDNKLWLGPSIVSGDREFEVPKSAIDLTKFTGEIRDGKYFQKVMGVRWFTNLDHGRRHLPLQLSTMAQNLKHNKKLKDNEFYDKYDNYNAIEVSYTDAIPSDYNGIMGVPISFLDKYNPDQFEILGMCENEDLYGLKTKKYLSVACKQAYMDKFGRKGTYDLNASGVVIRGGLLEKVYQRVLIKHKKGSA